MSDGETCEGHRTGNISADEDRWPRGEKEVARGGESGGAKIGDNTGAGVHMKLAMG